MSILNIQKKYIQDVSTACLWTSCMRNYKTRSSLVRDVTWRRLVVGYHFKTTYCSHLQGPSSPRIFYIPFLTAWAFKMLSATVVTNYQPAFHNIPELWRPQLYCTRILHITRFITFINWYRNKNTVLFFEMSCIEMWRHKQCLTDPVIIKNASSILLSFASDFYPQSTCQNFSLLQEVFCHN
jgi:hypothetical protein